MHLKSVVLIPLCACFFSASVTATPVILQKNSINGYMPAHIFVSTLTQAFCRGFSFCIYQERIWVKKDGDREWSLFLKTGLPHPEGKRKLGGSDWFEAPKAVSEIAADEDALFAFDTEGRMYRCYLQDTTIDPPFTWLNSFGWPKKQSLYQNDLVLEKRGWGMGVRRKDILWYEDRFGNQHHYGTLGLETIYFLTENGQEIRFTDSGLPTDFSHTFLGPERGHFIAENISVSGSTLFLINAAGEMYTRLIDFDTMGCDPMFFKYTYRKETQKYSGRDYLSNYSPWGLPNEDWSKQPDIPLTGKARLTRYLCIFQNGQGNFARGLRVAGLSPDGRTGYYHKQIAEKQWSFSEAPLQLTQDSFLKDAKPEQAEDPKIRESLRGPSKEYTYTGYIMKNNEQIAGINCTIPDFTITTEGSCTLELSCNGEKKFCTLYPLEMWTYVVRYNPGFDGTPRYYFITPSFDEGMTVSDNPHFSAVINDIFATRNLELYAFTAEATDQYIEINCNGEKKAEYTIFLTRTGTTISPAVFKGTILYDQPLVRDSTDKSLLLDMNIRYTVFNAPEISAKIYNNQGYLQKLKEEIKTYNDYHRGTTVSRWGFKTVDLLTSLTLLNKIDFPKIKTVTTYGNEIMDTNARNFRNLAEYRSLTYPYLIKLIKKRIDCYRTVLNTLPKRNDVYIDSRLRSSYPEYLEELGIGRKYSGNSPDAQKEAELEMYRQTPFYPGFQLKIGTADNADIISVELPNIIDEVFKVKPIEMTQEHMAAHPIRLKTVFLIPEKQNTDNIRAYSQQTGYMEWNGTQLEIWENRQNKKYLLFTGTADGR